jgi:hypothetical protein
MPPDVPELPSPRGSWALLNLILTVAAATISILLFVHYRRQRRELEEDAGTRVLPILSFVASAVAVLLFIFTQNLSGAMVFKDALTVWHAAIVVAEAVIAIFALKGEDDYEEKLNI